MIFSEFKAATDLANALYTATTDKDVKAGIEKLRDKIFMLQGAYEALKRDSATMQERQMQIKQFEVDARKYTLQAVQENVFLYQFNATDGDSTPLHYACPKCMSNKKIAILQNPNPGGSLLKCIECGADFVYKETARAIGVIKSERDWSGY